MTFSAINEPEHPAVDWSDVVRGTKGIQAVATTCPACRMRRYEPAGQVRYRVRRGIYTGYCFTDRLLNKRRETSGPRPPHPAVDWSDTTLVATSDPKRPTGTKRVTKVAITCPKCREKRYQSAGPTEARIRIGKFTGVCLWCSKNAPKREWTMLGPGRKLDPVKGYVRLQLDAVRQEHRPLFDAMKGNQTFVLEHRMVKAIQIGRPLASDELVDHMDGDKTNNDPENLRIYRRGRNDPGDTSGYGTFYDEWQQALARVRELEQELASSRERRGTAACTSTGR